MSFFLIIKIRKYTLFLFFSVNTCIDTIFENHKNVDA